MLCLLFVYPFSNGLVKAFHTKGSKKDANGRYGKTKRSLSVKKSAWFCIKCQCGMAAERHSLPFSRCQPKSS